MVCWYITEHLLYKTKKAATKKAAFLLYCYNSDFGSMHSASEMRIRVLASILPSLGAIFVIAFSQR